MFRSQIKLAAICWLCSIATISRNCFADAVVETGPITLIPGKPLRSQAIILDDEIQRHVKTGCHIVSDIEIFAEALRNNRKL